MNIQEIVNSATRRMKEPSIANVSSESNEHAMTYLESANKVARSIVEVFDWSNLLTDYSFYTVDGVKEYVLPSDYKKMATTYMYNIDNNLVIKSETSDRTLAAQASKTTNWTAARFRIIRDNISFTVPADQINELKYTYVSNQFVKNAEDGIIYKDMFTTNNDTFLLDDELLILGIVIDLKAQYGFDNSLETVAFGSRLDLLTKNDKGNYILSDTDEYKTPFSYPSDYQPVGV